jgi:hypothetical protein
MAGSAGLYQDLRQGSCHWPIKCMLQCKDCWQLAAYSQRLSQAGPCQHQQHAGGSRAVDQQQHLMSGDWFSSVRPWCHHMFVVPDSSAG